MEFTTILIIIAIVLVILVVGIGGLIVYIRYRFFRFGKKFISDIIGHVVGHVRQLPASQKILEYDKVLDTVLGQLGYTGSLGEKMKQHGKNFKNQDAIWSAHKERNKLAHEVGYSLHEKEAKKIARIYEREIESLLGRSFNTNMQLQPKE